MILIDIEMPSCCAECPLYNDFYDYPVCNVTNHSKEYNFPIRERRMPTCLLREQNQQNNPMLSIKVPKMPLGWTIK